MNRYLSAVFAVLALGWNTAAAFDADHPVKAELLADTDGIEAGTPFRLGVKLVMDKGWHTYWAFGGDAGQPTQVGLGIAAGL